MPEAVELSVIRAVGDCKCPSSFQGDPKGTSFLGVVKQGTKFSLGCRRDNFTKNVTIYVDCTVGDGIRSGRKVGISGCPRPCFRNRKVRGIALNIELHARSNKSNCC